MNHSLKVGIGFGLTSGIITTLGLISGLNSATDSKAIIIGGIITIAIADAFSDSLGIHISEESEGVHSARSIWLSTFFTFLTKFLVAFSFLVPVILFNGLLSLAVSVLWGMALLSTFSYFLAKRSNDNVAKVIFEHLFIAIFVILVTHVVGDYVKTKFNT